LRKRLSKEAMSGVLLHAACWDWGKDESTNSLIILEEEKRHKKGF